MNETTYTKLSELVDSDFTIQSVRGYRFKAWNNESKKMISEDSWFEGSRKIYELDTNKGKLDLSESQLGTILVKCSHGGRADVNNVRVAVKSNGKSGIDIRYYFNPLKQEKPPEEAENGSGDDYQEEDIATLFSE